MNIRNQIKYLLFKENSSITQIAEELTKKTGKQYTLKSLSQKLSRGMLRAEEFKLILEILGYEIKVVKKVEEN